MKRQPEADSFIETDTDDNIERIREVGGQLVILDADLAEFYGVTRTELRAMVRRNKAVLSVEFVVPLELDGNRTQTLAFTEHGVIVAASLLDDPGIEAISIHLVRAFVKLREENASQPALARRIEVLNEAVTALDARIRRQFAAIYEALGMAVLTGGPGSSSDRKPH